MSINSTLYSIWLSTKYKTGGNLLLRLSKYFSDIDSIYHATRAEYENVEDITENEIYSLTDKNLDSAGEIMHRCFACDIQIVTYFDEIYPKGLRDIENPPCVLYCKGTFPDFNNSFTVAVVGSRNMTPYGAEVCCRISSDLAVAGCTVLSGMALGIDALASGSAIMAGGKTAVILACGCDVIYPKTHDILYNSIIKSGGAVISEYIPGTSLEHVNFRPRNRLLAAIANCVLAVEGEMSSGTAITAQMALDSDKTLYTVPENITEKNSELPLYLMRNGAKPISSAYDIFADFEKECFRTVNQSKIVSKPNISAKEVICEFGIGMKIPYKMYQDTFEKTEYKKSKNWLKTIYGRIKDRSSSRKSESETETKAKNESAKKPDYDAIKSLGDDAYQIYKVLENGEATIDELAGNAMFSEVLSALTVLELYGYIESMPGGRVRIKNNSYMLKG